MDNRAINDSRLEKKLEIMSIVPATTLMPSFKRATTNSTDMMLLEEAVCTQRQLHRVERRVGLKQYVENVPSPTVLTIYGQWSTTQM